MKIEIQSPDLYCDLAHEHLLEVIAIQSQIAKLGLDLGQVMTMIVDQVLTLLNADGAVIELAEGDEMVYRAASGMAKSHIGLRLKQSESLSGLCIQTGEILRCDNVEIDSRVNLTACHAVGLRSMIVMPLKHNHSVIGVLKALSKNAYHFDENHELLLNLLAVVMSSSMFFAAKFDKDALFHKATHDGLTDLANRSLFMDRLRNTIEKSKREQSFAGVLMIDMDGLKYVNDTFGHRMGDVMIKELANRIKHASRNSDTVARLGGDEFAAVLTPLETSLDLNSAITRLYSEISKPFAFENEPHPLHASIGGACFPTDSYDLDRLLEIADERMYAVKEKHHQEQHIPNRH